MQGGLEGGELSLQQRLALIRDGSLAHRGRRGGRHGARQVLLVVLTERPPLPPGVEPPRPRAPHVARRDVRGISRQRDEARQPFIRIGQKARLAHLTVGDDINTDLGLLAYDLCHSLCDTRRELGLVDSLAAQAGAEEGLDALWTG